MKAPRTRAARSATSRLLRAAGTLALIGCALVTVGSAVSLATFLMPALTAAPPAAAEPRDSCLGGALQVVAHPDDDLLFQSPDLLHDVEAGRCTRTVFVTAADAGLGEEYWVGREAGARAAYAEMAGVEDRWTQEDAGVPGRRILLQTLVDAPTVSLVFMRLPDGNRTGSGMNVHDHQSLMRLWKGDIPEIAAVDGSEAYTARALREVLTALISGFGPTTVRTLDWTIPFHHGDSADHTATALFTRHADADVAAGHTLLAYGGYPQWTRRANVSGSDLQTKARVLMTYAGHDTEMCLRPWCAGALVSSLRVARQYVIASESVTNAARAPGVLLTASSESPASGQTAQKAVDGLALGSPGSRGSEWRSDGEGAGAWIEVAFPRPTTVSGVVLSDRPNPQDQVTAATLLFSDGSTVAVGPLPDNGSPVTVAFPPRETTSVRVVVDGVSGTTNSVGLAELEVYATLPVPVATGLGPGAGRPVAGSAHDHSSSGHRRPS